MNLNEHHTITHYHVYCRGYTIIPPITFSIFSHKNPRHFKCCPSCLPLSLPTFIAQEWSALWHLELWPREHNVGTQRAPVQLIAAVFPLRSRPWNTWNHRRLDHLTFTRVVENSDKASTQIGPDWIADCDSRCDWKKSSKWSGFRRKKGRQSSASFWIVMILSVSLLASESLHPHVITKLYKTIHGDTQEDLKYGAETKIASKQKSYNCMEYTHGGRDHKVWG